jgi:hypothetical protein
MNTERLVSMGQLNPTQPSSGQPTRLSCPACLSLYCTLSPSWLSAGRSAIVYANIPEWQKDNAQRVIEQARKTLTASLGGSEPPQVHTGMLYSSVVPALIDAKGPYAITRGQTALDGAIRG